MLLSFYVGHDGLGLSGANAVWLLLATGGPAAVTIRAVATEAGMSVGLVQHYIPSKEALLRDACRVMIEQARTRYDDTTSDADPLAALRTLVGHALPTTKASRTATAAWYALLTLSVADPAIAALLRDAKAGGDAEAERLLGRAKDVGQLAADIEVGPIARRLTATADGLMLRVLIGALSVADARGQLEAEFAARTTR